MKEPKNGEWWLCERGGVKTAFLRKDDEWRSDERDTYSYCNVVPLFKMIEDKPSDCAAVSPKRTRTEYEKVTESIFDLRDEFERGELYCKNLSGSNDYQKLNTEVALFGCAAASNVYQRVEKEIDERQEFIEKACGVIEDHHGERRQYIVEALFDSGKFKFIG